MRLVRKPALPVSVVLLSSILTTATGAAAHASAAAQTPPPAPTVAGEIVDYDFRFQRPEGGKVPLGSMVVFTNRGEHPHTVTDRAGTFDELVMPGEQVSIVAEIPGNITFFCKISASKPGTPDPMDGTIHVQASRPSAVHRVQLTDPARFGSTHSFDPARFSVEAGSSVQAANIGGEQHTLTADDGSFDTGKIAPGAEGGRFAGDTASFVVETPGSFPFHCAVHPERMRGVLTVEGQQPEPEPTGTPVAGPAPPQPAAPQGAASAVDRAAPGILEGIDRTWILAGLTGLAGIVIGIAVAAVVLLSRGRRWPESYR